MKMLILFLSFSVPSVWAQDQSYAPCPAPVFTVPQQIQLEGRAVLIVTHASTDWDGRFVAKKGIDETVAFAKSQEIPIVYLQGTKEDEPEIFKTYYYADCNPDYTVLSEVGEFDFSLPMNHVYTVGGHWDACQNATMESLMRLWKNKAQQDLRITYVMDALYLYGSDVKGDYPGIKGDPYKTVFDQTMNLITQGMPESEFWSKRKINLLQMMEMIPHSLKLDFLKREIPLLSDMPEIYRVVIEYKNDQGEIIATEVMREMDSPDAPTLTFEYIPTISTGN